MIAQLTTMPRIKATTTTMVTTMPSSFQPNVCAQPELLCELALTTSFLAAAATKSSAKAQRKLKAVGPKQESKSADPVALSTDLQCALPPITTALHE